jgi:fructokinase
MQKTILSFGEMLWDLLPTGPVLGGAPFNLAYRLCALGDRALIVTRLGRDRPGNQAMAQIIDLDMDASFVQRDNHHPTGTVEVKLDEKGNPDFSIVREVAYDYIEPNFELMELAASAQCFCFGTLVQRSPVSALTLQRLLGVAGKGPRFLDLNLRQDCYDWQSITFSIGHASVLKMNADEARGVAFGYDLPGRSVPDLCAALVERCGLKCCIVTLGEHGAFAASADGQKVYVPGYQVEVADTCGAGDAFSAGFLHAYLSKEPISECCKLGTAFGAMVACQKGATEPISRKDLNAFAGESRPRLRDPAFETFAVA